MLKTKRIGENMLTIANLSGGRDSTAMVIRYLELGNKIDYILFCDTGFEFPEMYDYVNKLDSYLQINFNKSINWINKGGKENKDDTHTIIEKWAFIKPIEKGDKAGSKRGLPMMIGKDYCTRETKIKPTKLFLKDKCSDKFKVTALIGYTHNEVENGRVSNLDYAISKYPLHEWGWNEKEVSDFLSERQIMNPLYNHFQRTGCFFCPKQSKNSLYNLYKHYPEQWDLMKALELKAVSLDCANKSFKMKFLWQYEKEFELQSKQGLLFDENEYKEHETCFCGK